MFNSVRLATNKVPVLFDEDGNEFIFNKDGEIIRIYNIGYFSLYNLEKYGKPELKVNEFYYTDGKDINAAMFFIHLQIDILLIKYL